MSDGNDDFDFGSTTFSAPSPKRSGGVGVLWCGLAVVGLIAAGAGWWLVNQPVELVIVAEPRRVIDELSPLKVKLVVTSQGLKMGAWTFGLVSGPQGAEVDPVTGEFTWTPTEEQGPDDYKVTVGVKANGREAVRAEVTFSVTVDEINQLPIMPDIPSMQAQIDKFLAVKIVARDADKPAQKLSYRLVDAPPEATLGEDSGTFAWKPGDLAEASQVTVRGVVADGSKGGETPFSFVIQVEALTDPARRFLLTLRKAGMRVEPLKVEAPDHFTGRAENFTVDGEPVTTIVYPTAAAAKEDADQISPDGQTLFGKQGRWFAKTSLFRRDELIVFYDAKSEIVLAAIQAELGQPFAIADITKSVPTTTPKMERSNTETLVDALAKLHEKKDLLGKPDYPTVRKLFAAHFEREQDSALTRFFNNEGAELKTWLDAHLELKEELYTAITPQDDLANVLKLLQQLLKESPGKLDDYWQLALATALTWDNSAAAYDYATHQLRTHSTLPDGLLGPVENFRYFLDAEKVMEGRAQFLPWEFQLFLVNHKTPRLEREWAAGNYLPKRTLFGKCYAEVPYDTEMLKSGSRTCKLDGKDYTLKNIKELGGVCAMQADFAARVGKSLGVPAEYVSGEANNGALHAWVMWVEVKQVTKTGISFTLESHGRYFGDKYYVGQLRDPQTAVGITDRQLELRLQAVGLNPLAFRHAKLLMQVYPQLRDKLGWKASQEIVYLNSIIDLCPGNEVAWEEVAKLARDGKVTTESYRLVTAMFDKLFRTFANFPDFTWKVFDDLVQYQKNDLQRIKYYEKLVQMYEASGRPDLSCEARLKLCDYQLSDGKSKEVINGLAYTIKKFPEEGRYVPKLLDKLEQVCADIKGADQQLLQFYQEFIPLIPQKRGNESSSHCMKMLERAIRMFTAAGLRPQAQTFETQLARLKASEGK